MARTTGSNDLFNLVHSLNTAEKGYFQKFAKRHASVGSKHLDLFNDINKQAGFEEDSLKKKYRDYTVMKVYLFDMILDSMLVFHKGAGGENEQLINVLQIDFLQQKGLADKALQLTQRAIEEAKASELFHVENILARKYYAMNVFRWTVKERHEKDLAHFKYLKLIRDKQSQLDRLKELSSYISHYNNLQSFHADCNTIFPKHFDTSELFNDEPLLSIMAEREKLACLCLYFRQIHDFGPAYNAAKKYYELEKGLIKNKSLLAGKAKYRHSLRTLIIACLHTNRYNEVFALCDEMQEIKLPSQISNVENDFACFTNRQYAYWGSGQHLQGEQFTATNIPHTLIAEHSERYALYVAEIYKSKLLFEHSNNSYDDVFKSIALLQSLPLKKIAPGYYKSCELLKILMQVELEHFEILPQLINNAIKHLPGYGLTDFEKEVLMLLKKINPINKQTTLKKLHEKITATGQDILLFNAITLDVWISASLNHKPINMQIAERQADWEKK